MGAIEASICKSVQTRALHLPDLERVLRSWQAIPLLRVRVKGRELIDTQRMRMQNQIKRTRSVFAKCNLSGTWVGTGILVQTGKNQDEKPADISPSGWFFSEPSLSLSVREALGNHSKTMIPLFSQAISHINQLYATGPSSAFILQRHKQTLKALPGCKTQLHKSKHLPKQQLSSKTVKIGTTIPPELISPRFNASPTPRTADWFVTTFVGMNAFCPGWRRGVRSLNEPLLTHSRAFTFEMSASCLSACSILSDEILRQSFHTVRRFLHRKKKYSYF